MAKKRVTFYLDESVYERFRKICDKRGLKISKKVELLMEGFVKKEGKDV